jgi:hypothetical protein
MGVKKLIVTIVDEDHTAEMAAPRRDSASRQRRNLTVQFYRTGGFNYD